MTQTVKVWLLGREFSIRTDDDPARVEEAARMVQERADELRQLGASVASDRLLTLVALNLAGELLQREHSRQQRMERLLSELDGIVFQAEGLAKAPLR